MGIFLFLGSSMAALAAFTLLWRGTLVDRVWKLNPSAYSQLLSHPRSFGCGFGLLSLALFVAGYGWFRQRFWGWNLAVVIVSMQVLGDAANCIRGDYGRGVIGLLIAGALLAYLLSPGVKNTFTRKAD
jgi:dolichol kinase